MLLWCGGLGETPPPQAAVWRPGHSSWCPLCLKPSPARSPALSPPYPPRPHPASSDARCRPPTNEQTLYAGRGWGRRDKALEVAAPTERGSRINPHRELSLAQLTQGFAPIRAPGRRAPHPHCAPALSVGPVPTSLGGRGLRDGKPCPRGPCQDPEWEAGPGSGVLTAVDGRAPGDKGNVLGSCPSWRAGQLSVSA